MANQKLLSPSERAMLFTTKTRKYMQELPSQSFAENQTLSFQLPRTRFLSKIYIKVAGTVTLTHASKTTYTASYFSKYNILKRIRLSVNNGFNPYDISANMLSIYNKIASPTGLPSTDNFGIETLSNTIDSNGNSNTINMLLELPIAINDRDPIGLMMLQNPETIVDLKIDCGAISSIMTDTDITISSISLTVTPMIETFSIPENPNAIPDFSVVKLVNEQSEGITNVSQHILKLPVGMTYRKFGIYLASDSVYTPIPAANVSKFTLQFNQADSPISISAQFVAHQNKMLYNGSIPLGCYIFDLSSQGLANMGSGRDYIDTERLTEAWLKIDFTGLASTGYQCYLFAEKLAKMA